ncbi:hypothetical protein MNBD_GAMMA03-506 [hydrothermal vent metagenome]|uniref:Uncharacterized protein n=1 Tax=hydrothermal vent metagenome TaxID=652676 RepID=A0A3B0WUM4_9ZZZZ
MAQSHLAHGRASSKAEMTRREQLLTLIPTKKHKFKFFVIRFSN